MQPRRLLQWRVTRVAAAELHGPYAVVSLVNEAVQRPLRAHQAIYRSAQLSAPCLSDGVKAGWPAWIRGPRQVPLDCRLFAYQAE
jgi:hypothetical protein